MIYFLLLFIVADIWCFPITATNVSCHKQCHSGEILFSVRHHHPHFYSSLYLFIFRACEGQLLGVTQKVILTILWDHFGKQDKNPVAVVSVIRYGTTQIFFQFKYFVVAANISLRNLVLSRGNSVNMRHYLNNISRYNNTSH